MFHLLKMTFKEVLRSTTSLPCMKLAPRYLITDKPKNETRALNVCHTIHRKSENIPFCKVDVLCVENRLMNCA